MNGFSVVVSYDGSKLPEKCHWKPLFEFQQPHRNQQFRHGVFFAEQFTPDRFSQHKFFDEEEDGFLVTEGLITNITTLCERKKCRSAGQYIRRLTNSGYDAFKVLHGNFAGAYFDKASGKLTLFNNQTGTQKLYYYKDEQYFAAGTDLKVLSSTLRELGIRLSPDNDAVEMLLNYGFMLEDYTLISQIRQITAGQVLQVRKHEMTINRYFDLGDISKQLAGKAEIIGQLDDHFREALREEYEIDNFYGYQSVATLSGGLDSRMTALIAHQCDYQQELINFSQKGYADEVIARQIAEKFSLNLTTIHLSSESLTLLDEVVRVNDGLTLYSGASHVLQAFKSIAFPNPGILHTGMLGDAIMGSYLKAPHDTLPMAGSGAYSAQLTGQSAELFHKIATRYRTDELFMFYNRAFQGINTGYQYLYLLSESLSPFMHPDFIRIALSIPHEYMYKEKIYIDWMTAKHPEQASFCWENIGGPPTTNELLRTVYRLKRAVVKRLPVKSMWKNSMTPEQHWYETSTDVRTKLDTYFNEHLTHPLLSTSLRMQLSAHYALRNFTSKAQVLTILSAFKSLFP